jgi:hypothetical protein
MLNRISSIPPVERTSFAQELNRDGSLEAGEAEESEGGFMEEFGTRHEIQLVHAASDSRHDGVFKPPSC